MKFNWLLGGCAFIALSGAISSPNVWGQEEEIKVRVRAITQPNGQVEVVQETVEGAPKGAAIITEEVEERVDGKGQRFRLVREVIGKTDEAKDNEQNAEKASGVVRRYLNFAQGGTAKQGTTETAVDELPKSEYWIGVQIGEVPPEVRKHMAVKHGILILHVYPDSPAAKAELQVDDVLYQVGDAKVETATDLIKAVDAVKTNKLSVKLLREGSEKTFTVTPVKRPNEEVVEARIQEFQPARLQAAERELQRALSKLQDANAERATLDFMLVRPGAYVHGEALPKMPDDVSIQVTKEGSKPAKVVVRQGDKSYEGTEGKLDEIPKELRPHVERMLVGAPSILSVQNMPTTAYGQKFEMKVAPPMTAAKIANRVAVVPKLPVAPIAPAAPVPPTPPGAPAAPLPGVQAIPHFPPAGVAPMAPGTPLTPASPRIAWLTRSATTEPADTKVDAKLDQILKKLDSLGNSDLDAMKKELKALRKEVDALQKKSSGSESDK